MIFNYNKVIFTLFSLIFWGTDGLAQSTALFSNQELGLPIIRNISPEEHGGFVQNWDIVQDHRGIIYTANNNGVLEYDGVNWKLISIPGSEVVRSLAVDTFGRVYVGSNRELGYLKPDSIGNLYYESLVSFLPEEMRNFGNIWSTYATSQGIYFCSDNYIFRWQFSNNTTAEEEREVGEFQYWKAPTRFPSYYAIGDSLYIFTYKTGIQTIVDDSLQLIQGGEFFALKHLNFFIPFSNEELPNPKRFLTGSYHTKKFYIYDGASFQDFPLTDEARDFIWDNRLYDLTLLNDNTYAVGTLRNGVGIIDQQGRLVRIINMETGIRNEFILRLFSDREGGLWLGLGDGLARIEYPSPITNYGEELDFDVIPNSIVRHQKDLFIATQNDVSKLNISDSTSGFPSFSPLPDIKRQTYQLVSVGSSLLIANQEGLYEWIDGKPTNLLIDKANNTGAIFSFIQSRFDPSIFYAGTDTSVIIIKKLDTEWLISEPLKGISANVRFMVEGAPNELWIASFNDFCMRITFPDSAFEDLSSSGLKLSGIQTKVYGTEKGMPLGGIKLQIIDNQATFNTSRGLMVFNPTADTFELATSFGEFLTDSTQHLNGIYQDREKNLWVFTHRDLRDRKVQKLIKQEDGSYELSQLPPIRTSSVGDIPYRIYEDSHEDGVIWIGANNGLLRFDEKVKKDYQFTYKAFVRHITVKRDSTIFGGTKPLNWDFPRLDYHLNELRFEYAAPFMDDAGKTVYKYYLEGFDQAWSEWTSETQKDYTNLSEGTYHFRVKAKNVYGYESEEGHFTFSINPPWYRTWWAYLCYAFIGITTIIGIIYFYSKWRLKRLEAYNRKLEEKVEEQTQKIINAQEQLIMQEKMASLGQMTTGLAHEIKNPLNFINNFAMITAEQSEELVEELEMYAEIKDAKGKKIIQEILEDMHQNLEDIREYGKRADTIINSMMLHAVEGGYQQRSTDINDLLLTNIQVVWEHYNNIHQNLSIIIEKDFDESLPTVNANPQKLGLAFKNFVDNAFYALLEKQQKHSDKNYVPTFKVYSTQVDGQILIKIRDNGLGIPSEVKEQIFTPFFSTKPTGKGNTGMGLSISYDVIVQGHSGTIEVNSETGSFTEFLISLPVDSANS